VGSRGALGAVLPRGLLLVGSVSRALGRVLTRGSRRLVGSRLVGVVSCVACHFCSVCLVLEAGWEFREWFDEEAIVAWVAE
jgi:hypothetical protein